MLLVSSLFHLAGSGFLVNTAVAAGAICRQMYGLLHPMPFLHVHGALLAAFVAAQILGHFVIVNSNRINCLPKSQQQEAHAKGLC